MKGADAVAAVLFVAWLPSVANPLPISARDGEIMQDSQRAVHLQTSHGSFVGVTWGESGKTLHLTVEDGCCAPSTAFYLREWRGLHVLQSVPFGFSLGVRNGSALLMALPSEGGNGEDEFAEEEVVDVVQDLVASRCVSLRFGKDAGHLVQFADDSIRTGAVSSAGLDAALVVVDESLRQHLEHLNTEGYAVVPVLSNDEVLEARASLESVIQRLTSMGRLYSNGYQVNFWLT